MQSGSPTLVPPSSQNVDVEQRGTGVRLIVETGASDGVLDPEKVRLLETYSPMFIVFPEVPPAGEGEFEPPHRPDAGHDYHPRRVEVFLRSPTVRTFYATASGPLAAISKLLFAYALVAAPGIPLLLVAGLPAGGLAISVLVAVVGAAVGEIWLRIRAAPAVEASGVASTYPRIGISGLILTPNPRFAAWKAYRDQLRRGIAPRTSYARVFTAQDGELYLQYWQFYAFNDWDNWHEADWEVVMVRLGRDLGSGWSPLGAVYSSHLGGLWREWSDVKLAHGDGRFASEADDGSSVPTHPVVWVALGSHAQYFESMDGRYKARLTQRWGFAQYGGWLSISSDATDRVASEIAASEPERYRLRLLPDNLETAAARDWWWLRFAGFWGQHEGIRGPAKQADKWHDPPRWVEEQCVGDPGVWSALVS